jgi:hypothetical protein
MMHRNSGAGRCTKIRCVGCGNLSSKKCLSIDRLVVYMGFFELLSDFIIMKMHQLYDVINYGLGSWHENVSNLYGLCVLDRDFSYIDKKT